MNPVSRFLYWNMNYHVEHHMFPMVPYHALPQLHEEIKADLPGLPVAQHPGGVSRSSSPCCCASGGIRSCSSGAMLLGAADAPRSAPHAETSPIGAS